MTVTARPTIFDCVLFNGEIDVLLIRLNELASVVDVFVIVEGATTFSGQPRKITFDPGHPSILPFANRCRHIVVTDFPETENAWDRERWQRNAVLRGIPDAQPHDLVIMADVDEIPRADVIAKINADTEQGIFGLELSFFYFFVDYWNSDGPESAITWSVVARRRELDAIAPDTLRYAVRDRRVPACIVADAGWHFSYLMNEEQLRRKIAAFSHQEFNNDAFLNKINIGALVSSGGDLFDRAGFVWSRYDIARLPMWLRHNRGAMRHLFLPSNWVDRLLRRLRPAPTGTPSRRYGTRPPVVICPYLHDHELPDVRHRFGLDRATKPNIEFYFYQDKARVGPERAFQHCWEQFPNHDIVIVHSDMAPYPGDDNDAWLKGLCRFRDEMPQAGMIAANLYFPPDADGQEKVQCAGGTYSGGVVDYWRGEISQEATTQGVTEAMLGSVRPVDWVTFGGVLIRREVIETLGGFDQRYTWAYFMDTDYCLEARLRGFQLVQVPCRLLHEESRTTRQEWTEKPELTAHITENRRLFEEKWRGFQAALPSVQDLPGLV